MDWQPFAAFAAGLVVASVTTPAGVSGAVLLLPVQVSVLGVPSPAVTPTNLLYNVVATPSGLFRYGRRGGALSRLLVLGTVPGVVVGAIIRVEPLPSERPFLAFSAGLLASLGLLLLFGRVRPELGPRLGLSALPPLAFAVGVAGGIYGVGGGSLLAPLLVVAGYSIYEVAPATLLSTLAASVVGIATFLVLAQSYPSLSVGPKWSIGLPLGAGGLVGSYLGAWAQPRISPSFLRGLLSLLLLAIAAAYTVQVAS